MSSGEGASPTWTPSVTSMSASSTVDKCTPLTERFPIESPTLSSYRDGRASEHPLQLQTGHSNSTDVSSHPGNAFELGLGDKSSQVTAASARLLIEEGPTDVLYPDADPEYATPGREDAIDSPLGSRESLRLQDNLSKEVSINDGQGQVEYADLPRDASYCRDLGWKDNQMRKPRAKPAPKPIPVRKDHDALQNWRSTKANLDEIRGALALMPDDDADVPNQDSCMSSGPSLPPGSEEKGLYGDDFRRLASSEASTLSTPIIVGSVALLGTLVAVFIRRFTLKRRPAPTPDAEPDLDLEAQV